MNHGSTTGRSGSPTDHAYNAAMTCLIMSRWCIHGPKESDCVCVCVSVFRLDFDYLNELPVLVMDVGDDFKNDRIKQEEIIDKVGEVSSCLVSPICVHSFIIVSSSVSLGRSESFSGRFNLNHQSQRASSSTH